MESETSPKRFADLGLHASLLTALTKAGYEVPTPIQEQAIPIVLTGADLMATAKTGTGKTAAFSLPLLQKLVEQNEKFLEVKRENLPKASVQALILSPTRELAQQIEESLKTYSTELSVRVLSVVGGLPIQKQIQALKRGVDILVATPGRLLDLLDRKAVHLDKVNYFVLDEADRMLDMGFVHDVRDIARKIRGVHQTLLFSATTSGEVEQLSRVLLNSPQRVSVSSPEAVADNLEQVVCFVDKKNKRPLLFDIVKRESVERALIFTATKSDAEFLATVLTKQDLPAEAMHSDKHQKARQKALDSFANGKVKILVATDVMARGIDVDGISHVINFDLPSDPESYVHRIGRTARAGGSGKAISFCDYEEVKSLQAIERFIKEPLVVDETQPFHSPFVQTMKNQKESPFANKRKRYSSFSAGKRRA
ncbi:MAG: DEAD/DEAH box helicase [Bdellovibrionales bacterium]|nr:DEAD/DEAH box helicase [Bdellovibrionales bacterium]